MSKPEMLRVEWNGESREIADSEQTVVQTAPGHYLVSDGSSFLEVFEHGGKLSDGITLDQVEIRLESERERIIRERFKMSNGGGAGGAKAGGHIVKAPMPGLVRAINVAVGDAVEKTTTLVVLEAMKMENNILAGAKGHVQKILVTQGNSVDKNAPMIEIG